ncbi:MAG TPA: SDR family oxidoreductase [Candidatus Limnocylindrales bacterium]|nr:SDR family oxidoreductase [Candidatus Limnocylindrales bacterium]
MQDLKGKTALITGGAHGLGRAITLAAAQAGAQVAFTFFNSVADSDQTSLDLRKLCARYRAIRCDVRSQNSVSQAVERVEETFGGIDVLINNAGLFETAPLEDITEEQWDNLFAVNVRGPFLVSQKCIPALRQSKGRIVNLGSLGGEKPWATHAHYCSSKAALHMLTRVMAKALAPEIAVNCVAPGMIDPGEGERDTRLLDRLAERAPAKRNGTPEDVVSAVMYFAAAPRFITGQIMTVDGGLGLV